MLRFINLFFVPIIAVYMLQKQKEDGFKPSLELLMQYAWVTVLVIVASHMGMAVIYRLFQIEMADWEPEYTLLALASSCAIAFLYRIVRFRIGLSVKEK